MSSVTFKVSRQFGELLRCRGDGAFGLARRFLAVQRRRLADRARRPLSGRSGRAQPQRHILPDSRGRSHCRDQRFEIALQASFKF